MRVKVTEAFVDRDGHMIKVGTTGELVQCDKQISSGKYFYNIISEGRVLAVTLGVPPVVAL